MRLNPLYFRSLNDDTVFVSNMLGAWDFAKKAEFLDLIAGMHPGELESRFAKKGFVGTNTGWFDKAAETRLTTKFASPNVKPSLFMVVPTLRCDHNCEYCQVSRAPLDSKAHDLMLRPESLAKAIAELAAPSFKLEFQGGEALLRQDFIVDTVESLNRLRPGCFDVVVTSALGPDLGSDFLSWCKDNRVGFSVSFDGVPEIHTKHRKSYLFDSFTRFRSQLEKLRANGIEEIGYIQTMTASTFEVAPETIIQSCLDLQINRLFSRPLQQYGFAALTQRKIGYATSAFIDYFEKYFLAVLNHWAVEKSFFDDGFAIYLSNLFRPQFTGYVDLTSPSAYGLQATIINYDGHIFGADEARMLYETTKNDELILASVQEDGTVTSAINPHAELVAESFIEFTPHCDTCAYQPFCGSDIAYHLASQGNGVGLKPASEFCESTMGVYDFLLRHFEAGDYGLEEVSQWLR